MSKAGARERRWSSCLRIAMISSQGRSVIEGMVVVHDEVETFVERR